MGTQIPMLKPIIIKTKKTALSMFQLSLKEVQGLSDL
jgi:hypothetical protein